MSEADRVRAVYDDYARDPRVLARRAGGRAADAIREERRAVVERALLDLVGPGRLPAARVLDVGCGYGAELEWLASLGVHQGAGVDVLADRAEAARRRCPAFDVRTGDGRSLPWPDASFDVAILSTVLSSVLDDDVRSALAAEVARVVAPGGGVLVYDTRRRNPRNPNLRPVRPADLDSLFAGWRRTSRSLTVLPPLTRALARARVLPYRTLARLPVLRTHLVSTLAKP